MKFFSTAITTLLIATSVSTFAQRAIVTNEGAVSTVHPIASQAAAYQLENGGNAIDAAIAAVVTLGVVDSYNSGIGGGLFALIRHSDGRIEAIDAREMAPAKAYANMYLRNGVVDKNLSRTGALAIGIPGSVAALEYLATSSGSQPFFKHWLRAATLAESGVPIDYSFQQRIERTQEAIAQFPATKAIFLRPNGLPLEQGDLLKQKDLAKTYRNIAKGGADYFYRGEFAQQVEQWMKANNGIITAQDFANYELVLRAPLLTEFEGRTIVGFPPPSSGGVHVAQILMMAEALEDLKVIKTQQRRLHLLADAMKHAFADRAFWLGDPDFADVPKGLLNPKYLWNKASRISTKKAATVTQHGMPPNWQTELFDKHTTHISVADNKGNWVAITTTLNTSFGSKVVIPKTGVIMNNQMDDFSAQPGVANAYGLVGSEANAIAPGKRPLSSMSPTIVLNEQDEPIMSIGAAGGPMIITQVVQGIINHLELGLPLDQAIAEPRIHHQWRPDRLMVEKTLPQSVRDVLIQKGHNVHTLGFEGTTTAVSRQFGEFTAASDPRIEQRNQPKLLDDDASRLIEPSPPSGLLIDEPQKSAQPSQTAEDYRRTLPKNTPMPAQAQPSMPSVKPITGMPPGNAQSMP